MMSRTLELKVVSEKSPSDWPRPGKSKRRHAIPDSASALLTRAAPGVNLEPVKQWANIAYATGVVAGRSRGAAIIRPSDDGTFTLTECTACTFQWLFETRRLHPRWIFPAGHGTNGVLLDKIALSSNPGH